jgi:hypothetical protein
MFDYNNMLYTESGVICSTIKQSPVDFKKNSFSERFIGTQERRRDSQQLFFVSRFT